MIKIGRGRYDPDFASGFVSGPLERSGMAGGLEGLRGFLVALAASGAGAVVAAGKAVTLLVAAGVTTAGFGATTAGLDGVGFADAAFLAGVVLACAGLAVDTAFLGAAVRRAAGAAALGFATGLGAAFGVAGFGAAVFETTAFDVTGFAAVGFAAGALDAAGFGEAFRAVFAGVRATLRAGTAFVLGVVFDGAAIGES
ncbi:MAG: hypothetical protein AAF678_03470 [Pseudomonadota bacterium]